VIRARSAVIAAACVFAPVGLVVARELSPDPPSPPSAREVAPSASCVAADGGVEPHRDPSDRLIGLVLPRESADVGAAVPGRLIAVHVRMGDRVRQGQPIATLDARLADADITAAEAAVRSQEVEQSLARGAEAAAREHEARVRALAEHGLAPGEELVNATRRSEESSLRTQASASLLAQKVAQLQRLSLERRLMEVRAPFAGVIAARYLDPGTAIAVAASQPIARVISEALVLRVALPESQAGRLHPGTRLIATNPANGLSATARVERVAAEIDPIARIWLLEAGLESAPSTGELTEGAVTSGLELTVEVPRVEVQ
jgi:RND family efflux transporter MFP subunit